MNIQLYLYVLSDSLRKSSLAGQRLGAKKKQNEMRRMHERLRIDDRMHFFQ